MAFKLTTPGSHGGVERGREERELSYTTKNFAQPLKLQQLTPKNQQQLPTQRPKNIDIFTHPQQVFTHKTTPPSCSPVQSRHHRRQNKHPNTLDAQQETAYFLLSSNQPFSQLQFHGYHSNQSLRHQNTFTNNVKRSLAFNQPHQTSVHHPFMSSSAQTSMKVQKPLAMKPQPLRHSRHLQPPHHHDDSFHSHHHHHLQSSMQTACLPDYLAETSRSCADNMYKLLESVNQMPSSIPMRFKAPKICW